MTQKAFSYRFYPTPEQENLLRRTIGCTRLVYNRALAARTEAWYKEQAASVLKKFGKDVLFSCSL